jgi:hypothetical protein
VSSTNSSSAVTTWSGLDLNYDAALALTRASCASRTFTSAVTPQTITMTNTGAGDEQAISLVSFSGNA